MKEDFLHYVWQYKKFVFSNLTTVSGEQLTIVHTGHFLKQSGPDFFNAQIIIGEQKWAGNVEMHLKSSDWYVHHHEMDDSYDNVILHVVWEHDVPVYRKDNSEVAVLELKSYVAKDVLESYQKLAIPKTWIYCENQLNTTDNFVWHHWKERLFFERLKRKAVPIQQLLQETGNDWEAVLFLMLAKNFGLNTNGETFLKLARSIPFSVVRKESTEVANLEALFLGKADLLPVDVQDFYGKDLKSRSHYINQKHRLKKSFIAPVQFFKLRPDNFPTIRLAQLAMLYHCRQNLFSSIIDAQTVKAFYDLFSISVSEYWQTHYHFDKISPKKRKCFSKSFIDLLIINTIVPLQFSYAQSQGKDEAENLLRIVQSIVPEKNSVIEKFATFGIKAVNAFDTQSLLQLKNDYCNQGRCLQCAIGTQLLTS